MVSGAEDQPGASIWWLAPASGEIVGYRTGIFSMFRLMKRDTDRKKLNEICNRPAPQFVHLKWNDSVLYSFSSSNYSCAALYDFVVLQSLFLLYC